LRKLEAMIAARAPLAGKIAVHFQHEGDRMEFEDESGKIRTPKPREVSAKFEMPKNLSSAKSIQQMEESLRTTVDDAARQSEGILFTTIDEAIAETGNAIDARGKPFSPGLILDLLDGVQIEFDDRGQPIMPTIVLHPDLFNSIKDKFPTPESDPEWAARRREILARKKEEWRDRESDRKLVG